MVATFQQRHCQSNDAIDLAYKVAGHGDLSLVFMHGWGSTKDYFDETVKHLDLTNLKVIAFDLRGHGDSQPTETGFSVEQLARDMLVVADDAGAGDFVAVGHSMGAKYVQYLPLLSPGRVRGQILIAGTPSGSIPVAEEVLVEWAGYAGNRDALRTSHHAIITRPIPHAVSEQWIAQAAAISRDVLYQTLKLCFVADFAEDLARLEDQVPTLAIGGEGDPFFSPQFLREQLVSMLPGCRFVVMDCGHEIPLERPLDLAWQIEAFCAGVAGASRNR